MRRVIEEIELYDEDELEYGVPDEPLDWELCQTHFDNGVAKLKFLKNIRKGVVSLMKELDLELDRQPNWLVLTRKPCKLNLTDSGSWRSLMMSAMM